MCYTTLQSTLGNPDAELRIHSNGRGRPELEVWWVRAAGKVYDGQ